MEDISGIHNRSDNFGSSFKHTPKASIIDVSLESLNPM